MPGKKKSNKKLSKKAIVAVRLDLGGVALAATVPIDFQLKLVEPSAHPAPSLRVEAADGRVDVTLGSSDGKLWTGGISAATGAAFNIFASSRVNKGGSMTLEIKEPGFSFPAVKVEPVKGVCTLGPLPYQVG